MKKHQNKIEKLIAELCPDGVEFKSLGEIGTLIRGSGLQKKDFVEDGVGCIHYGQIYTYYGAYAHKTKSFVSPKLGKKLKKVNKGDLVITSTSENIEDVCKSVAWLGEDEIVTGGHATILKHHENTKYLSYCFQTTTFSVQKRRHAKGTKVIDVSAKDLAKIKIPIPPLAIQEEIVKILDSFTELEAGLEAELETRKKQYEYYRDELLTFGDDVEWKELGGLCDIGDGLHGTPSYDHSGRYYFINGNNLSGGKIVFGSKTKKVDDSIFKRYGIPFEAKNTVLMSINGTIGSVSIFNNEKVVLGKSIAYFNLKVEHLYSRFLFYFLQTTFANKYYEKQKTGSTIKNLGLKALRQFKIPVPSPSKQRRIVAMLDKFDALVNDISVGLPAELKARRAQYEYYRDKLLIFKEYAKN